MIDHREQRIIDFIRKTGESSSKEVFDRADVTVSYATLKRILAKLISENYLATKGQGKGTKYVISPAYKLIQSIDIEKYHEKEIDEREINEGFNFSIITDVLAKHNVFTESELLKLSALQNTYQKNIAQLSENEYKKELERLAIDLSWKSSQICLRKLCWHWYLSRTYSHLWTEIKEQQEL